VTTRRRPDQTLSLLRIYLRRRNSGKPGGTLWERLRSRSLSNDLAERALRAGIAYATVTLGHAGFVSGAKRIVADISDVPPSRLPTCVELVGVRSLLEAFVEANRDELADAVLLRLDGVSMTLPGTAA
jgi:PII-like signaling protein